MDFPHTSEQADHPTVRKKHPRGPNFPPSSNRPPSEVTWSSNTVRTEGSYFLTHVEKNESVPFTTLHFLDT